MKGVAGCLVRLKAKVEAEFEKDVELEARRGWNGSAVMMRRVEDDCPETPESTVM
jgi:hypothetical protein